MHRWPGPPWRLAHPAAGEVHVWRAPLDVAPGDVEGLAHTLTPEEQADAERFRFAIDGKRFVVARGRLRAILGRYTRVAPAELVFGRGPHGKPVLVSPGAATSLRFNVSHSEGLALYAFAWEREVGVDVERVSAAITDGAVARAFFSPRELEELDSLPAHRRSEAFFTLWTHKEAYVKARGQGLSGGLNTFSVSLRGGPTLLEDGPDGTIRPSWSIVPLAVDPGFAAALAVEGWDFRVHCWSWR